MHRLSLWISLVLLVCTATLRAEGPLVPRDIWDAAYMQGVHIGYYHTSVREGERDGQKVLVYSLEMELTLRRYGEAVRMGMATTSEETPEGKVVAMSSTTLLDGGQQAKLTARVDKGQLVVQAGPGQVRSLPWDPTAIGPVAQERLLTMRKPKSGEKIDFLSYEPSLLAAVKMHLEIGKEEEVDVLVPARDPQGKPERVKRRLLRVDLSSEKVRFGPSEIQLPPLVSWVDDKYQTRRNEMEMPGMGVLTLYRTTEAVARQKVDPSLLTDLGLQTLVPLNRTVPGIHEARGVVYRITVKGDDDPSSAFARDERQQAGKVMGQTFELTVRPVRQPGKGEAQAPAEYLSSNRFVTSDDDEVKALTARAVGRETDPWKKALLIEKYVKEHMTPTSAVGFTTAAQIARDPRGDCRQHALLTAAMCRAAGVPSRTALGLVYFTDRAGKPLLCFHMWTEVYVGGRWVGIDATLGRGGVGPGHLKVNDHSWADTQSLAPLLPVLRVIGKTTIEVVGVE